MEAPGDMTYCSQISVATTISWRWARCVQMCVRNAWIIYLDASLFFSLRDRGRAVSGSSLTGVKSLITLFSLRSSVPICSSLRGFGVRSSTSVRRDFFSIYFPTWGEKKRSRSRWLLHQNNKHFYYLNRCLRIIKLKTFIWNVCLYLNFSSVFLQHPFKWLHLMFDLHCFPVYSISFRAIWHFLILLIAASSKHTFDSYFSCSHSWWRLQWIYNSSWFSNKEIVPLCWISTLLSYDWIFKPQKLQVFFLCEMINMHHESSSTSSRNIHLRRQN